MLNNTLKQLKTLGKESLSLFKAVKNDICQEIKISKQVRQFKKELRAKEKPTETAPTHAHEEAQN